jgi:hypothetical protein
MSGFFIEYNCNPKKLNIQDCVIRAMSLAFDKDWRLQYQELVSYIKNKIDENKVYLTIHAIHHRNEDKKLPEFENNFS